MRSANDRQRRALFVMKSKSLSQLLSALALLCLACPASADIFDAPNPFDDAETLKFFLSKSTSVVVATVRSSYPGVGSGPIFEPGVVKLAPSHATVELTNVGLLYGTAPTEGNLLIHTYRMGAYNGVSGIGLETDKSYIFFLKPCEPTTLINRQPVEWSTADIWFGVYPFDTALAEHLKKLEWERFKKANDLHELPEILKAADAATDRPFGLPSRADGKAAATHTEEGKAFYQAGRFDDAMNAFTKALALDRNNKEAHEWISKIFVQRLGAGPAPTTTPATAKASETDTVIIRGAVRAPQTLSWTKGLTLKGAFTAVGGFTWDAPKDVSITRRGEVLHFRPKALKKGEIPDPLLEPGDVIDVP